MKISKKERIWLLIFAVSFLGIYFSSNLFFINSKTTCAHFARISGVRTTDYYHYSYMVDGNQFEYSVSEFNLKLRDLDSLKKIECVEIEYSVYFPSFSRVVDKRILK